MYITDNHVWIRLRYLQTPTEGLQSSDLRINKENTLRLPLINLILSFTAGSDYETDEEAEVDDYVPEMHHRPIRNLRNHRHRATTHLLKRPITNPTSTWKKYHRKHGNSSASTTDTEGGQIPTAKMYFERKKYRTMSYHSTRNSTRLSASQREGNHTVLHPNLSSINMCMSTVAQSLYVPDNSTIHSTSPSLPGSQNTRESADGQTNTVAHTSTPKDDTGSNSKLRTAAFNATGHSQCLSSGDCCRQGSDTPKRSGSRTLRSKAMSTRSTEVFCDCVNPQQCSCSTSGSDVNSKPVALVRNRLSQEVSLWFQTYTHDFHLFLPSQIPDHDSSSHCSFYCPDILPHKLKIDCIVFFVSLGSLMLKIQFRW